MNFESPGKQVTERVAKMVEKVHIEEVVIKLSLIIPFFSYRKYNIFKLPEIIHKLIKKRKIKLKSQRD